MSVLLYSLQTIVLVSAKVYPIVEDRLELCTKPEDRAGKLDYSGLEIVLLSHEEAFLNGTLKFLKQVKSPWKSGVFVERFHRGKWNIEAFNKKNEDFCVSLRNPLEPFYYITSRYISQKCPIPAGVRFRIASLETALTTISPCSTK